MTRLEKRLLGLMQLGGSLNGADGHIWIESCDKEHNLNEILQEKGILLNNKIYGGVLEALDTIDACLLQMGLDKLGDIYNEDILFMGKGDIDWSRIDKTEKHRGGLV